MAQSRYDVVGIGNAIVDVFSRCDETFLSNHGMEKGFMQLITPGQAEEIYAAMGPGTEQSGGSVANSCAGVASLGGTSAFVGRVASDQLGSVFAHDIRSIGVSFDTPPSDAGLPTARSLILITPDGERTMNTFLGASTELDREDVDLETIAASSVTYLEGYLFDRPAAKEAFHTAARLARDNGRKVALSLSDAFCVDRHRDDFLALVRDGVDVLFANEKEITALYEVNSFEEAASAVRAEAEIAALTRSEDGSVIISGDETVTVPAAPIDKVVDATGAGDLYAAGFLYGMTRGKSLQECGLLGSMAAAEIISHVGARPETSLRDLAKARGLLD